GTEGGGLAFAEGLVEIPWGGIEGGVPVRFEGIGGGSVAVRCGGVSRAGDVNLVGETELVGFTLSDEVLAFPNLGHVLRLGWEIYAQTSVAARGRGPIGHGMPVCGSLNAICMRRLLPNIRRTQTIHNRIDPPLALFLL